MTKAITPTSEEEAMPPPTGPSEAPRLSSLMRGAPSMHPSHGLPGFSSPPAYGPQAPRKEGGGGSSSGLSASSSLERGRRTRARWVGGL